MKSQQDRTKIREALAMLAAAHADAVAQTQRAIEELTKALEHSPILQGEPPAATTAGRGGPRADRETLSVAWRGRSCFLGNTLLFWFFERLARSPNRYVSHVDLLADVWGGQRGASTIRGVAKRLRGQLTAAGMPELARAIDGSATGYYGLMLV